MTELAPASSSASSDASSQQASSQQPTPDALPPVSESIKIVPPGPKKLKGPPESEIGFGGMVSYGNWQFFAAGIHEWLYTAGFEYYRHSWGYFAGAQMDYAADFMPLVILKEPRTLNPFGVRRSRPGDDVLLHGVAFSPIGLRMQWRHDKTFKPYFSVLGGAIGFTKKALSPDASYYDFTLHETIGFYYKMTERVDMRVGLFGDFHFSNAYITSYNPGLDVMNSQIAMSYRFGRKDDPHP
ncbi:MAG TPA: acyloxyacyl hydrolase [Acidobacteriaceae bacterium]|nr:acyloxyacyl hydrolase [Acidobacteriaceae bacterium]